MESQRFDRFAQSVGRLLTRRSALGPLAGLGLAGLTAVTPETAARNRNQRKRRRQRRRGSSGVRLLEELAETLTQAGGDCETLSEVATRFQEENDARIKLLLAEEAGLNRTQRSARARRDQERVTAATERLLTLLASCGFRGATPTLDSLLCDLSPGGDVDPPGLGFCEVCACSCMCPISVGDCIGYFFVCLVNHWIPGCCWATACASHQCSEQCASCCNLPDS